jgi:hypothetical protein
MATHVGPSRDHTTEDRQPWSVLAERGVRWDLPALAAAPLTLCLVFSLPDPVRERLVLVYAEPSPLTVYSAHFVHYAPSHLLSNLLLYLLVVPTAYLLAASGGHIRLFRRTFAVIVMAVPSLLSALNVLLGTPAVGFGFSGVNMALFGLFCLLFGNHLTQSTGVGVGTYGGALFAAISASVALFGLPHSQASLGVAGGAVCLGMAYLVAGQRRGHREATRDPPPADSRVLTVAGSIVFLLVAALVLQGPATGPAAALGLYVHFLGFALAYTAAYLAVVLKMR